MTKFYSRPRFQVLLALAALAVAFLACDESAEATPAAALPTAPPAAAPTDSIPQPAAQIEGTLYGFFPTPPEVTLESVLNTYEALGENGDVVLLQQVVPWQDFVDGDTADSRAAAETADQFMLAERSGLEVIYVVDPLNGLNRSEFYELPFGWKPSFASPKVRAAFTNYALHIVREFQPRYIGLTSEINTYADANPDDFEHFLSLYAEVYDLIKAEAPETQVFVTFQWDDLNNAIPNANEGRDPFDINWEQVEVFEPRLDVWAISSYPFAAMMSGADIPDDYYTPLLERTSKPLAVAEGGFTSADVGPFSGSEGSQVDYLQAIDSQIGQRLDFWIYLILSDFNAESFTEVLKDTGHADDADTLGLFSKVGLRHSDGTPKPALAVWTEIRAAP